MSNWLECVNSYVKKSEIVACETKKLLVNNKEEYYRVVVTTKQGLQINYACGKNRAEMQERMLALVKMLDEEE